MSKKVCTVVTILILFGVAGFLAPQVSTARAERAAAVVEKKEAEKPTLEERVEALGKNQETMIAELKEIRETQEEILRQTKKIFIYMKRR